MADHHLPEGLDGNCFTYELVGGPGPLQFLAFGDRGLILQESTFSGDTMVHLQPSNLPQVDATMEEPTPEGDASKMFRSFFPSLGNQQVTLCVEAWLLRSDHETARAALQGVVQFYALSKPTSTEIWENLRKFLNIKAPKAIVAVSETANEDLAFVDLERAITPLYELIGRCADLFYKGRANSSLRQLINAPYFAVVQSSGTGKSTCLYEVCKHFKFSAFLLLQQDDVEMNGLLPRFSNQKDRDSVKAAAKKFLEMVDLAAKQENEEMALDQMKEAIQFAVKLCKDNVGTANCKGDTKESDIHLLVLDEAGTLTKKEFGYKPSDAHTSGMRISQNYFQWCRCRFALICARPVLNKRTIS